MVLEIPTKPGSAAFLAALHAGRMAIRRTAALLSETRGSIFVRHFHPSCHAIVRHPPQWRTTRSRGIHPRKENRMGLRVKPEGDGEESPSSPSVILREGGGSIRDPEEPDGHPGRAGVRRREEPEGDGEKNRKATEKRASPVLSSAVTPWAISFGSIDSGHFFCVLLF